MNIFLATRKNRIRRDTSRQTDRRTDGRTDGRLRLRAYDVRRSKGRLYRQIKSSSTDLSGTNPSGFLASDSICGPPPHPSAAENSDSSQLLLLLRMLPVGVTAVHRAWNLESVAIQSPYYSRVSCDVLY